MNINLLGNQPTAVEIVRAAEQARAEEARLS